MHRPALRVLGVSAIAAIAALSNAAPVQSAEPAAWSTHPATGPAATAALDRYLASERLAIEPSLGGASFGPAPFGLDDDFQVKAFRTDDAITSDVDSLALKGAAIERSHVRSVTSSGVLSRTSHARPGSDQDMFHFSRAVMPLLIDTLPGIASAPFTVARPMVGPVVGVRPAYVRAATYR